MSYDPQDDYVREEAPRPRKGWLARNWFWSLPIGCLVVIAVCGGLVGGIAYMGLNIIKTSQPYTDAVNKAKADPAVQAALGNPVEAGWMMNGSVNQTNNNGVKSGDADLTVPLTGPKGSGNVHVVGKVVNNNWEYSKLEVTIDGTGQKIDLRPQ
ncbi:MAG TPA: cytochrome c oxidase assembly factor Coa1 family protein [Gemmataceae bacterium]|nr:cytochrome c oxidase assembly factor Coa1 family protein [Gemmataceae bacterium]